VPRGERPIPEAADHRRQPATSPRQRLSQIDIPGALGAVSARPDGLRGSRSRLDLAIRARRTNTTVSSGQIAAAFVA